MINLCESNKIVNLHIEYYIGFLNLFLIRLTFSINFFIFVWRAIFLNHAILNVHIQIWEWKTGVMYAQTNHIIFLFNEIHVLKTDIWSSFLFLIDFSVITRDVLGPTVRPETWEPIRRPTKVGIQSNNWKHSYILVFFFVIC